jgi:hypothetical protein
VEGRILNNIDGNLLPAAAAHVWIENVDTGKVMASGLTSINGRFSINSVPPGNYRAMLEYLDGPVNELAALNAVGDRKPLVRPRAFRSVEIASRLHVAADKTTQLSYVLVPPQNSRPALVPSFIGINGDLSTAPVPVAAGKRFTLYVGGEGVDQIPGGGLVFNSPFITVDAASLASQQFYKSTPVISFDVSIAPNAPPGDYSIRLQSNSGETAYLVGGIKISPAN